MIFLIKNSQLRQLTHIVWFIRGLFIQYTQCKCKYFCQFDQTIIPSFCTVFASLLGYIFNKFEYLHF